MGDYCHLKKREKPNQTYSLLKFLKLSCFLFTDPFISPILLSYTATFCPSNHHKSRFCLPHARKQQHLLHREVTNLQPMDSLNHHKKWQQ